MSEFEYGMFGEYSPSPTRFGVQRYHDISCGHRVFGHESKCIGLHGHNYRITFFCEPEDQLDAVGRVIDFSIVKSKLCDWVEENWDHRFLLWENDPLLYFFKDAPLHMQGYKNTEIDDMMKGLEAITPVPFNPTAENMAGYLLNTVAPKQLYGTGVTATSIRIDETRKCSATAMQSRN